MSSNVIQGPWPIKEEPKQEEPEGPERDSFLEWYHEVVLADRREEIERLRLETQFLETMKPAFFMVAGLVGFLVAYKAFG